MRVWKVVDERSDGGLYSSNAPYGRQVTYAIGVTTKPRFGCPPLAAFVTRKAARDYKGSYSRRYKIYKAVAEVSLYVPDWASDPSTLPPGTGFYKSITLLEKAR